MSRVVVDRECEEVSGKRRKRKRKYSGRFGGILERRWGSEVCGNAEHGEGMKAGRRGWTRRTFF